MSAFFKQRHVRGAHARIAAEEVRTGGRVGLLVLLIVFFALVAILWRLAEFSGGAIHTPPHVPPGVAIFSLL